MAVQIRRWTGTSISPVKTRIDGFDVRFSLSDLIEADTSSPIPRPDTGIVYSYWIATRLYAGTAPNTTFNNIKWYYDGDPIEGVSVKVATASAYTQASGTPGITGLQLTTGNYPSLNFAPVHARLKTKANPMNVSGSTGILGDFGDFVVIQLEILSAEDWPLIDFDSFCWLYDGT